MGEIVSPIASASPGIPAPYSSKSFNYKLLGDGVTVRESPLEL